MRNHFDQLMATFDSSWGHLRNVRDAFTCMTEARKTLHDEYYQHGHALMNQPGLVARVWHHSPSLAAEAERADKELVLVEQTLWLGRDQLLNSFAEFKALNSRFEDKLRVGCWRQASS